MDIENENMNIPDGEDGEQVSLDPVHPDRVHPDPVHERPAPPKAVDLGFPAVLDHRLVAVGLTASTASTTPVTIYGWADGGPETTTLLPLHAQVWARAGRVTLVGPDGLTHRLTLLAEDEYGNRLVGEHWPLGESDSRTKRVASAALHDLGDVLTFPAWLARTAHTSGERNAVTGEFLRKLTAASPDTVIQRNQTFGTPQATPGQLRPYDHRGLVGHEGYPGEL
jgi:hypothetical protein